MKKLPLLFLLIFPFTLWGQQQTDSLKSLLDEVSGYAKAELLNQLSVAYNEEDSVQALFYANQALSLSIRSANQEQIANSYFNIGECLYYFDELEKARPNYSQALKIYTKLDDKDRMGETYNSIGLIYHFQGQYDIALQHQIEALKCLESSNNKHEMAHVYSNIGMMYSRLGNYALAIHNYQKAATINSKINDKYSIAVNYNGIGTGYYNMNLLDSAIANYKNAMRIFEELDDQKNIAVAQNNIANIYAENVDSIPKALSYYQKAISVFDQLNENRYKIYALEGLGCVYRSLGQYDKALQTFRDGLLLAHKYQDGFYFEQLFYKDISETYEKLGMHDKALFNYKLYNVYEDSLRNDEQIKQVIELEKKYEKEKNEVEIARLNAEAEISSLQIQKSKVTLLFGIITILLLTAIIAYISYAYYNKRKINLLLQLKNSQIQTQKNELEILNASKNKFFSIIAHDLKNPFHTVLGYSSLLDKEYERFSDADRQKYARDIFKSTHSIFRLLQNLLDWSRSQTGRINFEPIVFDFKGLSENIHSLLKPVADNKKIMLEWEIAEQSFVYADPIMVETILRNLVSNAIKFSYENSTIRTTIELTKDVATICVRDFGVGISKNDLQHLFRIDSKVKRKGTSNEDGSGLGLVLCKEFIEINNGTICAQSELEKGSTFCVTLPTAKQKR